jgi:hypothetical protein
LPLEEKYNFKENSFPHPPQENTRNTSDKKALLTFSNDCISTYFATYYIYDTI